ncbi:P-loop NTPase fold protein [Bacillus cereus]|uniref:KAP family P-loop NTPase fold protein n=1 Tax=Bacillus cereus group sp. BfR-BA-01358 TaxID=2920320 RepID=UPI001F579DEC|nr:P-loop NTPase fold protein [Bacillus cereus group sp. BfR-BA-01358]MDA1612195.1 P-loop NTPase fold protein [Bacillus cereus]MDA2617909.1 P-loop NTPase fold protein [Bacillus cereus]
MIEELHYLPLNDIDKDRLGFKEKAEEIAAFINDFSPKLPYCVSINGSWGAGKSTMLNFLETNLDKGKCITVRFNPWMISEREELIRNLFEEIYYAMGEGDFHKAKDKFFKYAEKLVSPLTKVTTFATAYLNGVTPAAATTMANVTGETVQGIGDLVFDKPLSKRKHELNKIMDETIRADGQKIVIMIDELDRLFPEEVITIFQMIKSNLDLPGFFFVVAMDQEVVFDALKEKGISKPEYYLQKIFQRKYLINTKYQLETLTNNFISKSLNEKNDEAHQALNGALKTYFYGNLDYFAIKPEQYAEDYHPSYGMDWAVVQSDRNTIVKSYLKIIDSLDLDINLHNPRTFLNFSQLILERWSDYYKHVFDREKKIQCFVHVSFLIFIAHCIYPSFIDPRYINGRNKDGVGISVFENENIPTFIRKIDEHIGIILPNIFEISDRKGTEAIPESIITTSVLYLTKFPDYGMVYSQKVR